MAQTHEGTITCIAGEALEPYRRVKYDESTANTVVYADASDANNWIGCTVEGPDGDAVSSGDDVTVVLRGADTMKVECSAAVTLNADVYPENDGKVSDDAGTCVIGKCAHTEAGSGSGSIIAIHPWRFGSDLEDHGHTGTTDGGALTSPVINTGINDANGNELVKFTATASAVNEVTIENSATGVFPIIAATGEADTGLTFENDQSEEMLILDAQATAVNEFTIKNAAADAAPEISATGGDTNISIKLTPKGTGVVQAAGPICEEVTQTAETATATLTIAELLTGVIDGTPTAAATYTLPTAELLVAGIANARVGDSFTFLVNNKSSGANTITMAAGSGGTGDGTLTVAQNVVRMFRVFITNVTASSEAYYVYGIGA